MGQRLNLELVSEEGKNLNIYYHWSGYTTSSLELAKELLTLDKTDLNSIFEKLQNMGARLTEKEVAYVVEKGIIDKGIIKIDYIDRNEGLIAFSKEGMEETKFWQECYIKIDFSRKLLFLEGCLWKLTDIPTILENHKDTKNISTFNVEFSKFDEFNTLILESDYFEHWDEMYIRIE